MKPNKQSSLLRKVGLILIAAGVFVTIYVVKSPVPPKESQDATVEEAGRLAPSHSDGMLLEAVMDKHASTPGPQLSPPEDSPQVANEADEVRDEDWNRIGRNRRSVGRLFALAPQSIEVSDLVRNSFLNVSDKFVSREDRRALAELLGHHRKMIMECEHSRSAKQSAEMTRLESSGGLRRVTRDDLSAEQRQIVDEEARYRLASLGINNYIKAAAEADAIQENLRKFFPEARACRRRGNDVFFATARQLESQSTHREYGNFLRQSYFNEVISWFVVHELAIVRHLEADMKEFDRLMSLPV